MTGLFDELKRDGEAAIERWIEERQGENIYFDCKAKKDPSKPKLDQDDRKNLGKTLCAFANSDGGLLLWGVDARKENGVDCLIKKKPIEQITAFRSEVEHAIADLISPPIPDLEFLEIPCSQNGNAGYLAISVPCSERRPHMSRSNTEPGFYFRNGHQSVLMEVFQVRDQMLRRAVPKLEFEWDMRVQPVSKENVQQRSVSLSKNNVQQYSVALSLELILKNNSIVSARFPYLIVRFDRGRYVSMGGNYQEFANKGLPIAAVGPIGMREIVGDSKFFTKDWEFPGGADCCIHPGTGLRIAAIQLKAPASPEIREQPLSVPEQTILHPSYDKLPPVIMEISYGCLDAPREKIPLELNADEMHRKLESTGQTGSILVP